MRAVFAAFAAFADLRKLRGRTWIWFAIYCCSGLILMEAVALGFAWNRQALVDLALWYLFPEDWHLALEELVERLLSDELRLVLTNAGIGLGILLVGVTCFPLKEALSSRFDRADLRLDGPRADLPLWRQALQESKLVLIYAAVQLAALHLGLLRTDWSLPLAMGLGYWFLVVSLAIDHLAPVLQRRGVTYSSVLALVLWRAPITCHLFGALLAAPLIVAALLLVPLAAERPALVVLIMIPLQVLTLALAALVGCALGGRLAQLALGRPRPWLPVRLAGAALIAGILIFESLFFSWLLEVFHHKSQILKCTYAVDWRSVRPQLRPVDLKTVRLVLNLDLRIDNPSPFDVAVEDGLFVEVTVSGSEAFIRSTVAAFAVPAGEAKDIPLTLDSTVDIAAVATGVADIANWKAELVLEAPMSPPVRIPLH